jgi:Domain of unknown function (DUF3576)
MFAKHYRLPVAFAASLSLALASCSTNRPNDAPAAADAPAASDAQQAASDAPDEIDTEATIWTLLGLAKKPSERTPGPQTGSAVSPILWQAAHDTLDFVKFTSEDPLTGLLVTDWYSPPDKPDLRYRVNVFILSRALHSDSIKVTVERQEQQANGKWVETTIARQVDNDIETAILNRARQLKRALAAAPG